MPEVVATTPSSPLGGCTVLGLDVMPDCASLDCLNFVVAARKRAPLPPTSFYTPKQRSFQPALDQRFTPTGPPTSGPSRGPNPRPRGLEPTLLDKSSWGL